MRTFVTALDRDFLLPTSVMLTSLDRNLGELAKCIVLTNDSDLISIRSSLETLNLKNLSLEHVIIPENLLRKSSQMDGIMHFSNAAAYRLFMADIIGTDINSIVYLDGDLFIRKKITSMHFPDTIFSAYIVDSPAKEALRNPRYFNSGVFSTQLDFWRENRVVLKLLDFLDRFPNSVYKDQDALNSVFYEKNLIPLPKELNYIVKDYSYINSRRVDPVIVHFAGHLKPWRRFTPDSKFAREWRELAKFVSDDIYLNTKKSDHLKRLGYCLKIDTAIKHISRLIFGKESEKTNVS